MGDQAALRVHFLKATVTFRACKAIFTSSKNGEVYAPETSCMKRTFVHNIIKDNKTALLS